MLFYVSTVALLAIFSGCGVSHQTFDDSGITAENSGNSGFQLVPEYEKTTGIMVNPGLLLYDNRVVKNDDSRFYKELSREYQGMLKALIENLPTTTIYAFALNRLEPDMQKAFGTQTSIHDLMQNQWLKNTVKDPKNVVLVASSEPDRWTRDYGAFSVRDSQGTKKYALMEYYSAMGAGENRGLEDNQKLAQLLRLDLRRIKNKPDDLKNGRVEGGGIMVDSKGRCFVSPSVPDQSWGCTEIVRLDSLPFDGTGHVDLYAKLINDQTVALADFESDLLLWLKEPEIIVEKEVIPGEEYHACDATLCGGQESKNPVLNFEKDAQGKELLLTLDAIRKKQSVEAVKKWSRKISDINDVKFAHDRSSRTLSLTELRLQEHVRKTVKKFEEKGFTVKRIKNPQPYAYLSIKRTLDTKNTVIKERAVITIVYRSYINSLIVNEKVFVPTFQSAPTKINTEALDMYRQLGFNKVIPLPMDYHATQAGAVHCLTHDLH